MHREMWRYSRLFPGWRIHVPGHPDEAEALLRRAVAENGRVYIRLAEDVNRLPRPVGTDRLEMIRRGAPDGPTVIAVGPMFDRVVAATSQLDATILYAATVRPFDHGTARGRRRRSGRGAGRAVSRRHLILGNLGGPSASAPPNPGHRRPESRAQAVRLTPRPRPGQRPRCRRHPLEDRAVPALSRRRLSRSPLRIL